MKKFLSRIFSVAIIAATVASPSMAQYAKKAVAPKAKANSGVTALAKQVPTKGKKSAAKADFTFEKFRSISSNSAFAVESNEVKPLKKTNKVSKPKSIAKTVEGMPTIYGSVIYANHFQTGDEIGLYQMPSEEGEVSLLFAGPNARTGGVLVDGVYYCTTYESFWGMVFIYTDAYELETGELVESWYPEDFQVICTGGYTLDPVSGIVYGLGFNEEGSGRQLTKIDFASDGPVATQIAPIDGYWNTIVCDGTGQLYGIRDIVSGETITGSELCKIDKSTGDVTLIGDTGMVPTYLSGAVIDPKTNRMFWNVCDDEELSYMCEVNLSTGEAEYLYELTDGAEVVGLVIPQPAAEDDAPAECENVEVVFNGGSLQGTVNLTAPSTLFDGSAATGNVTIHVLANGEECGSQSAAVGSEATVNINLTSTGAGKYTFKVYAENANGRGPKTTIKDVWVGADTPEAPSASLEYVNGNMEITWTPVTGTVNGGWLDTANLTYTVEDAEGEVLAEGLTDCAYSVAVEDDGSMSQYYYVVYAKAGDLVSAKARTNTVTLGFVEPPYTSDYAAEDGLKGWTIIDANEDGKSWTVYGNEIRVSYNSNMDMDDWLITPPLKLEAGKVYMLNFSSRAQSATFPERLEVKFGTAATPQALSTTLLEPTDITSNVAKEFVCKLAPAADGIYYVGFHGMSDADEFYLYLSNITVEAGVALTAPAAPSDVVVTPGVNGELKASVSFVTPTETVNGEDLTKLTKVEVYRGSELVKTYNKPACGVQFIYEDAVPAGGVTQYSVVAYNESGAGLKGTGAAFIGYDKPLAPATVNISSSNVPGEVVLNWSAVTEDVNGAYVTPNQVTYTVAKYEDGDYVPVAEGLKTTSYSFQAVEDGVQDFVKCAVYAVTTGGMNGTISDMIPVGTPYTSLNESFANGTLSYIWGQLAIGQGALQVCTDSTFADLTSVDGDGGYIAVKAQYLDQGAGLFSGLVNIGSIENPGLSFYTYNIVGDNPDINEITVSVRDVAASDEWVTVYGPKTVEEIVGEGVAGWGKVTVPLSAYAGKTIQFMITGMTKAYVYTMLDQIQIGSILAHDVAANSISAPEKVKAGENFEVTVAVANNGGQNAENISVELYADDALVATKTIESLEAGANTSVNFEQTMSGAATQAVTYYAQVVYDLDENTDNNQTTTISVAPILSTFAAPKNLSAENDADAKGIKLTWDEPNLEYDAPITWDFEDGDAFAAEYGDWTFVDGDESPVGGFQGTDVPGITPGTTTGSFWIWDASQLGNQTFAAHSGSKYLFALFRYDDGTTDDWAISPAINDAGQTISFYAKSYSTQYPEKIRVLYTTSDSTDPEDYVEVMAPVVVPGDWTLYEVALPAGAKHFAINSCATGSFMLMVDDVTYVPSDGGSGETGTLELQGYNVYRDGVKINDALVEEAEYLDTNVVEGEEYTYVVTAVYTTYGESAISNEVTITCTISGVNGIADGAVAVSVDGSNIVVLNALGQNVTVSSVNGAVIFNGKGEARTVVAVGNGVYVVKAGNLVKKVVVK